MANDAMKQDWNGETGQDFLRFQDRYDAMLRPWADLVAELAGVVAGERVLDVGCGCGATALDAATATGPEGAVVGVDLSEAMVRRAGEQAASAGLDQASFRVADAQTDDIGGGYDVVVSRFGLMFFDDPATAFGHLRAAVRPGGRLAAVVWAGALDQEWLVVPGVAALDHVPFPEIGEPGEPGMFGLADGDRTAEILRSAGWSDVTVERHTRPMLIGGGGDLDETVDFVAASSAGRSLLAGAQDEEAGAKALDAIRSVMADHQDVEGVTLDSTAWAIGARRGR